jgi:hypothetical protein
MKHYLTILFILLSNVLYSQCKDVYDIKADCPTEADSLVLYNNALKIYNFYDNNKVYQKTRTRELSTSSDKRNIFEDLATARRLFFVIRREVAKLKESEKRFAAGATSAKYVDITYKDYYQEIDEYRFYQRELESQIVNKSAPTAMYDTRIAPIIVNEYHCIDSTSPYFGDLVNIPLYIPVTVKPFMLLTEEELSVRNDILQKINPNYKPQKIYKPKDTVISTIVKIKDVIQPTKDTITKQDKITITPSKPQPEIKCTSAIPVYAYTSTGGALIGFLCNRYFIKIKPNQYIDYAVPKWAQEILENKKQLKDILYYKFGKYLIGIIE